MLHKITLEYTIRKECSDLPLWLKYLFDDKKVSAIKELRSVCPELSLRQAADVINSITRVTETKEVR